MDPATIGMLASTVSGFLGRKPKLPREVKNLYRFQYSLADQLRRMAQSTPLSDRYERQNLAEQQGRLGQQQQAQREQLFGGYNPDTMGGSRNDLMVTLGNEQIGQNMALQSQATLDALQYRRGLYQDAARVAAGATPSASMYGADATQPSGLSGALGALGQAYAKNQELKPPPQGHTTGTTGGTAPTLTMPQMGQMPSAGWHGGGFANMQNELAAPSPQMNPNTMAQLAMPQMNRLPGSAGAPNSFGRF